MVFWQHTWAEDCVLMLEPPATSSSGLLGAEDVGVGTPNELGVCSPIGGVGVGEVGRGVPLY